MSNELKHLGLKVVLGRMNRRDFIGRAAALGVAAPLATQLLSSTARANPVRGGHLVLGLNGGATTDSLDPGLAPSAVPQSVNYAWGETLVVTDPNDGTAQPWLAESWEASADAKKWAFRIRKGVTFSNGKTMTVDDVVATLKRHSDENSKSGALGILKAIGQNFRADGDNLVIELESGNADLPSLLSDYHLTIQPNAGRAAPAAGLGRGGAGLTLPGHRQARWRERGADPPLAAGRVGRQRDLRRLAATGDPSGDPAAVQRFADGRQEGLAGRPDRAGRLRSGRAGGEASRPLRAGPLRTGAHRRHAGEDRH